MKRSFISSDELVAKLCEVAGIDAEFVRGITIDLLPGREASVMFDVIAREGFFDDIDWERQLEGADVEMIDETRIWEEE